jgi:hypothetical protein
MVAYNGPTFDNTEVGMEKMARKMVCIAAAAVLVALALAGCQLGVPGSGSGDAASRALPSATGWNAARYGDTLDIGTRIRYRDADAATRAAQDAAVREAARKAFADGETGGGANSDGAFTFDGGTKEFLSYDIEGYYFKSYTLRSVGTNVEIWVANDLAFADDRPVPVITQEQVDTLAGEFDSNILPTDTGFFGTPDSHTGANSLLEAWELVPPGYYLPEDGVERVIMLVDNFKDEQYYDPAYPFFVAGFYSPSFEAYVDRNIINLDTKDWATRLQTTFFGVTAHEFQHLIHDDNDSLEELWLNEGMADFAEYLCGYGHPMGHVNFFLDHPENSLVEWDDHYAAVTGPETLADYGQAYLLTLYMYDRYGRDFIQNLAKSELHGMPSVDAALADINKPYGFPEVFRRFCLALVIDAPQPGYGIYEFKSIDVKVNFESAKTYDKDGVPAWGADYKVLGDARNLHGIQVDGIEYLSTPWKIVTDPADANNSVYWGNEGDELANRLILELDLRGQSAATLAFDTNFDIEEGWDFGIVQVSEDSGRTWTSLANADTRSDVVEEGYPAIKASMPGFTGATEGWVPESFDLTPYAGKVIHLAFNYMTDWASNGAGWFVDNISVPEIGLALDGSNLDRFISYDRLIDNKVSYQVCFVNEARMGWWWKAQKVFRVHCPNPFSITDEDGVTLRDFFRSGTNYMVTWYAAPDGVKGTVAFEYRLITIREWMARQWEKYRNHRVAKR